MPRIVLGKSVEALLELYSRYYSGGSPWADDVLLDEDGTYFVNYLQSTNISGDTSVKLIGKHRDVVSKGLHDNTDPGILEKYQWLRDYHNYFCTNFFQSTSIDMDGNEITYTECDEDLLIPSPNGQIRKFEQIDHSTRFEQTFKAKVGFPTVDFEQLSKLDDTLMN